MKILYAVQATGNGHISRAMELLPYLNKIGNVDIFLSGANSTLNLAAPIKFRSKGVSLHYTCTGSIDYWKLAKGFAPRRMLREARDLPVEHYDLILNDFECITALSCHLKKVPSIQFGHQASFQSARTPRPEQINTAGEWILKHYAPANKYIGLHFDAYDDFILPPVIKKEIALSNPVDYGHITVYLPSYCMKQLKIQFSKYSDHRFEIFCHQVSKPETNGNITWLPVSKARFDESLISCKGIITGGGFETPAEALFLRKKLIAIPIRGQYEQNCNGAALQKLGVPVLKKMELELDNVFSSWLESSNIPSLPNTLSTREIVERMMQNAFTKSARKQTRLTSI